VVKLSFSACNSQQMCSDGNTEFAQTETLLVFSMRGEFELRTGNRGLRRDFSGLRWLPKPNIPHNQSLFLKIVILLKALAFEQFL
jgi:hypothetical protein